MFAALTLVTPALDHVPEVRDDAGFDPGLAAFVEVEAPGIARAFGENFEQLLGRMITPHGGINPLAVLLGGAGLADVRRAEDSVAAVEPAVGAPAEGVERLVGIAGVVPAIEQDLRRTGLHGNVAILDRDEHEMRRGADPDAAEAPFETGDEVEVRDDNGAFVELVVPVGVLEADDAVDARAFLATLRIAVAFRDPEASAIVIAEGDGLLHVGFGGEEVELETGRKRGGLHGGFRGKAGELDGIGCGRLALLQLGQGDFTGELGTLGVQAEVVEADVAPRADLLVDDVDEDLFPELLGEIYDDRPQGLSFATGDLEEGLHRRHIDQFDARVRRRTACHPEARPRLRHLERHAGQNTAGVVSLHLETADPEVAGVAAGHVAATDLHRVATNRLAVEGVTFGFPVA